MDPLFDKKFISSKEASELSGYHSDYLARLCRSGKISGSRVGRTWIINRESLLLFSSKQEAQNKKNAKKLVESRQREYRAAKVVREAGKPRIEEASFTQPTSFASPLRQQLVAAFVAVLAVNAGLAGAYVGALSATSAFAVENIREIGSKVPALAADPVGVVRIAHRALGERLLGYVDAGLDIYMEGIDRSAVAVLEGGVAVRDASSDVTDAWVVFSNRVPAHTFALVYGLGDVIMEEASLAPRTAARGYERTIYAWSNGTASVAEAAAQHPLALGHSLRGGIDSAMSVMENEALGIIGRTALTYDKSRSAAAMLFATRIAEPTSRVADTSGQAGLAASAASADVPVVQASAKPRTPASSYSIASGTGAAGQIAVSGTTSLQQTDGLIELMSERLSKLNTWQQGNTTFSSSTLTLERALEAATSSSALTVLTLAPPSLSAAAAQSVTDTVVQATEDAAVSTYAFVQNLFNRTGSVLAALFVRNTSVVINFLPPGTTPEPGDAVIAPGAPGVTNVSNYLSFTGVSFDYLERRLAQLREQVSNDIYNSIDRNRRNGGGSSGGGGSGSVTSVDASGGTTGFSFSGGPVTSSGTLTLSGILDIDNGGTGIATAPAYGELLVGNGSGGYALLATSSLGISGGSGSPGGANTQVQFNNAGTFAGDAGFTYDSATDLVTVVRALFTNATTTSFGINSETFTDLTGTGLSNVGGVLTLNATGDWTGTFDGQEGSYYLSRTNHTGTQLASTISDFNSAVASYINSSSTIWTNTTEASLETFLTDVTNVFTNNDGALSDDNLTNNSIEDLSDVAAMTENLGDLLYWNGSAWADIATSSLNIALSDTTGVLGQTQGGTGLTTYTQGDLIYADALGNLARLGIGSAGQVLKVTGGLPQWGADLTTGGGGGAGAWATTSDSLAIYPADTSDVVIVGNSATTTANSILEVFGRSYFSNLVGIGTTSPGAMLSVAGNAIVNGLTTIYGGVNSSMYTATSTTATSTFPNATITNLSFGGDYLTDLVGTGLAVSGTTLTTTLGTAVDLVTEVTGTLGITNGGTGTSTPGVLGQVLSWNGTNWQGVATSTLGFLTSAVTAIGPAGQTADGPTVTIATTTDTNVGLTVTGSGDTLTFTSTWTGTLADARVADSLTVSGGTINNTPIGASTPSTGVFTNATTTSFGINSETFTDLTGTGLQNTGGALTLNATGDWTGTFDGQQGTYYLDRANHTGTQLASTISDFSSAVASYINASTTLWQDTTEASLEAFLTDVTNVFTNNDGALSDDDLTNNSIEDLSDVAAMTENFGDLLYWNGSAWADIATSSLGLVTNAITAIGPAGQTADGPTVTLATSTSANNGLTPNIVITGSGDTLTFTSSLSGTLTNAGLQNSTVSYGGVTLALGDTDATPAFNLVDATGLPVATGISGLASGIATWLATPSSANLITAVTDETGTGSLVFSAGPTFTGTANFANLIATNATTTNATTTSFGINSETFTDLTGTGLTNTGGVLTLNATGDWTGTFDGQEGSYYLARANHTGTQLASTISDFNAAVASYINGSSTILSNATEAGLEAFLTDVTNVFTNNDGALADDDLTNNSIEDLSDVAAMTENLGDLLYWNGSAWADIATSSLNISASAGGSDTQVQYNTLGGFGGDSGFTYSSTSDRLTVTYASTTGISSSYASSTSGFFGSLSIGSLTGVLKATAGAVSTGLVDLATEITGTLGVANGGTGAATFTDNRLLTGNGTGALVDEANLTFDGTTLAVTGSATVSTQLTSPIITSNNSTSNSNFRVGAATGVNTQSSAASLLFAGASNVQQRVFFNGTTATTLTADAAYGGVIFGAQPVTEAGSGTHPAIAGVAINAPVITDGAGATTDATSLYIAGAPSGITPTNAATAFWVDSGIARFDGNVGIATSSPWQELSVAGDFSLTGAFYDSLASAGANGYVLQSTGSATTWVATSSLNIAASAGGSDTQVQYNTLGTLGGDSGFTYSSTSDRLSVTYASTTGVSSSYASSTSAFFGSLSAFTNFIFGGDTFTDLTGTGLQNSGGVLTINATGDWTGTLDGIDGGSFLRSDATDSYTSGTLTFDAGTALDLNTTSLSIADTDIAFDGASTNFNFTGNFSANTDDLTIIKSSGNVGIGTTTPWALLSVNPDGSAGPAFAIGSSTATRFIVSNGGLVGIGTSSPTRPLTINSGSTQVGFFFKSESTSGARIRIVDGNQSAETAGAELAVVNQDFTLSTAGSEWLRVNSVGSVGIGTTSPFRRLSVTNAVSTAQAALAYDGTRYTDLLTSSVGDFFLYPQGDDALFNDSNLWVCTGGADATNGCPSGTPSGNGNIIAETAIGIGSSTPWTGLSIVSGKAITVAENTLATSTSFTVDWRQGNQQLVRLGTAGTTISFSGFIEGQKLVLTVCNPGATAGAITWGTQILWAGGTAPTQTTTANKCDVWSFLATMATTTVKIFGTQSANF